MYITRKGKNRNHGTHEICSTGTNCHIKINWEQQPGRTGRPKSVASIMVSLDNDFERSGGCEHIHFAHIGLDEFFQIAKVLSDKAADSDLLRQEIARKLGGTMAKRDKGELAINTLRLLTLLIEPNNI